MSNTAMASAEEHFGPCRAGHGRSLPSQPGATRG